MAGNPSDISRRLAEGPSNDISDALPVETAEPVGGGEGEGAAPSQTTEQTIKLDELNRLLDERIQPFKDRISEQDQELSFLRGSFQQMQRQQPQQPSSAAPPKPTGFLESTPRDQIVEGLRSNPIETLVQLIDDRLKPLTERIGGVRAAFETQQANSMFETQARSDIAELNQDYGHLNDNAEFRSRADAEFNRMRNEANGYVPGMLYKSATRAFNAMIREGKLQPGPAASSQPPARGTLSVVRNVRDGDSHGASNSVGGARESRSKTSGAEPRSIADLVEMGHLNQTDATAARKVMQRYDVTESQYVANFWADKKANPRYGER